MLDWEKLVATYGTVGALLFVVVSVLIKSGFLFRGEDHERSELIARLDKMNDKIDVVKDRLTAIEASSRELHRRVDRLDR